MQLPFRFLCKIAFWLALTGSYIAAIVPQNIAPHIGTLSDKLVHSLAFSLLAFLLQLAYRVNILKTIFFLLLYGLFIEASQYFTSSRSSEVLDVVADVVGIIIGILLYRIGRFIIALAVKNVLKEATLIPYEKEILYEFTTTYSDVDKILYRLRELGILHYEREFGIEEGVKWKIRGSKEKIEKLKSVEY